MARKSTTVRSLELLRKDGWYAEVTERYNSFTCRRHDLFGFADIIALKDDERPMLIQTTTGSNLAARRTKIMESPLFPLVYGSFDIVLHGWRKLKVKRGGKDARWKPKIEMIGSK